MVLVACSPASDPSSSSGPGSAPTAPATEDLLSRLARYVQTAGHPESCGTLIDAGPATQTALAGMLLTELRALEGAGAPTAELTELFVERLLLRCSAPGCDDPGNYCDSDRLHEAAAREYLIEHDRYLPTG